VNGSPARARPRPVAGRRGLRALAGLIALWCLAPTAQAQNDAAPRFELVPYAAYRFGGDFDREGSGDDFDLDEHAASGLILDIRADARTQWEVLYAHQRTTVETQTSFDDGARLDVDADYLQFGGTYLFEDGNVRPFIAMTVGVAHFAPGPSDLDSESYLSASLGGGVHLRAAQRIGVRLEARVFASLIESDSTLFCRSGTLEGRPSRCALAVDGRTLYQWEGRVGVVFRF
jgi:hypothetical protein